MHAPMEFWFDFSSCYAYFAAHEIDELAARHGRTVCWRPFMLGAAFKVTGSMGLSRTPMKGDYARHDWARIARLKNLPPGLPPGASHHPAARHPRLLLDRARTPHPLPHLRQGRLRRLFRRWPRPARPGSGGQAGRTAGHRH